MNGLVFIPDDSDLTIKGIQLHSKREKMLNKGGAQKEKEAPPVMI